MATSGVSRLFVAPTDLSGATIVRVAHPRTGHTISIARAGDSLLEINKWSGGDKTSWMLAGAERVLRDGVLFMATPIDPLFLLLPHLQGDARYFRPLSDCLSGAADEAALELTALALPGIAKRLRAVCDVKDNYDEPMVRLNEDKVMAWLRRKTEALRAFIGSDADVAKLAKERQAAVASQFESVHTPFGSGDAGGCEGADKERIEHAVALVAEYLAPSMQAQLCKAMTVDEGSVVACRGDARKAPAADAAAVPALSTNESWGSSGSSPASAASTVRGRDPPEAAPAAKKPKPSAPVAKAAKQLGGASLKKGQQTMMGFFGKK